MNVNQYFLCAVLLSAIVSSIKIILLGYKEKIKEDTFVLWLIFNSMGHYFIACFFFNH